MRHQDSENRTEHQRVRAIFERYTRDPRKLQAWSDGVAQRYLQDRKWAKIRKVGLDEGVDWQHATVLDLGTWSGSECPRFLEVGIRQDRLIALDLDVRLIRAARNGLPWLRGLVGDGTRLPFGDGTFDVVYQSTMISSILDSGLRLAILAEIGRVLRTRGRFISYDMRYPNPWNPNVRPLRRGELADAFDGWGLRTWSLTGIPPIIRRLAEVSLPACRALEALPPLRSHLLAFATKPQPLRIPRLERK